MHVLITGSNGQIGWEITRALAPQWAVHAADRSEIDLVRPETIAPAIARARPEVIVNAAAYTAVDRAEIEPELAERINGESVGVLAREARACGAAFVHISTDYVFDGTGHTPYRTKDAPNPQSAYGRSKLHGERAALDSGASCLIVRTAWVYSMRGRNFLLAILRQAQKGHALRIVNDQLGAPTWARAFAHGLARMIAQGLTGDRGARHFGGREGIYHLTSGGATSWFDFARAIFEDSGIAPPALHPISTTEYAARAQRPGYSVLDCSETARIFGVRLDSWRDALREALSDRAALAAALVPHADQPAAPTLTAPD